MIQTSQPVAAFAGVLARAAHLWRVGWAEDRGWAIALLIVSAAACIYGLVVTETSGTGSLRLHARSLEPGGLLDLFEGPHTLIVVQFLLPLLAVLWGDRVAGLWPLGAALCALGGVVIVRQLFRPRPPLRPYLAALLLLLGLALIRPLLAGLVGAGLVMALVPYEVGLWNALRERLSLAEVAGREVHGVAVVMLALAALSLTAALSPAAYVLALCGLAVLSRLRLWFTHLDREVDRSLRGFAEGAGDVGTRWPYRWLVARSLLEMAPAP